MFTINFQMQESVHANSWESSGYSLLNFKCLMTKNARFETQLDHVSASHVHAQMQATVVKIQIMSSFFADAAFCRFLM